MISFQPKSNSMKSSTPLVSIIIPVYNGSNYLKEAIDSALEQTYPNIEVIVVNDGSTDREKTEKIAKSYGNKIRYFLKKNGGVATALNLGIKKMRGEWFSWLSHDDIYEPYKISELIKYVNDHTDAKIIYTDYQLVDENGKHLHDISVKPKNVEDMQVRLIDSYPLNGCAMLINKQCFSRVGDFDESLRTTQDYELWYRFGKYYMYHYLPVSTLRSRQHPNQGSHSNSHKEEVDGLYSKFIQHIPTSSIIKEKGNKSGQWLLQVARLYKSRGYVNSPYITMSKYKLLTNNLGMSYWLTRIYCLLPVTLISTIADLEHKILRTLFRITGSIKNIVKNFKA